MIFSVFVLKALRKSYLQASKLLSRRRKISEAEELYEKYCELLNQDANDYVKNRLQSDVPCMISKFGTIELSALVQYKSMQQKSHTMAEYFDYIKGDRSALWWRSGIDALCSNAGFFPNNSDLLRDFYTVNIEAMKQIDVLGSYVKEESLFSNELKNARRVNLDGYYAPFFFNSPWTGALKGKRVLVVHPFAKSIEIQYKKREQIWNDPEILPDFELITIKAVQTMLGEPSEYKSWFEALDAMKQEMATIDYDIALIGCGAYGMPLAAYAKLQGKHAIHLAGWTQVLFGIRGRRWEDNPTISKFMNDSWVHPLPEEVPHNHKKVENGCYW